jgi:hypothetical protein
MPIPRSTLALVCLSCVILLGCGSRPLVQGTVTYQGQPLSGATVTFVAPSGHMAAGITDANGQFALTSGEQPAFAPGQYRVTVTKYGQSKQAANAADITRMKRYQGGRVSAPPESEIPAQYSDVRTSGLEATVTGNPRKDTFVFSLDVFR